MWNFLRGGATVIQGATFIPESRVGYGRQAVLGRNKEICFDYWI